MGCQAFLREGPPGARRAQRRWVTSKEQRLGASTHCSASHLWHECPPFSPIYPTNTSVTGLLRQRPKHKSQLQGGDTTRFNGTRQTEDRIYERLITGKCQLDHLPYIKWYTRSKFSQLPVMVFSHPLKDYGEYHDKHDKRSQYPVSNTRAIPINVNRRVPHIACQSRPLVYANGLGLSLTHPLLRSDSIQWVEQLSAQLPPLTLYYQPSLHKPYTMCRT